MHVYFCTDTYIYMHRDTQTYSTDGQTNKRTDRQILYIEADSQTAGKQAVRKTDLQTDVQKEGQLDRQTLKYLPIITVRQLFMQASRQAGG
jgi:hypothetical protein